MLHQAAGNIQPPANQAADPVLLQRVRGDTGSLVMHHEAPTVFATFISWELAVIAPEEPLDLADFWGPDPRRGYSPRPHHSDNGPPRQVDTTGSSMNKDNTCWEWSLNGKCKHGDK